MSFNVGFGTDIGRKRSQNQDSLAAVPELGLFVIADGMGGHKGGEIASSMTVEIVPEVVRQAQSSSDWNPKKTISQAIEKANREIFKRSSQDPHLQGMGTTTTALLFKGRKLTIGHVGDSRCYFVRLPGAIWQATRDHSLVQEKLRAGLITRADIKTDRMRNVITRSVGFEGQVNVETYEMETHPGDIFVICSDGLSGLIDDLDLLRLVERNLGGASASSSNATQTAVDQLIEAANANGGDDNISTIVVQVL